MAVDRALMPAMLEAPMEVQIAPVEESIVVELPDGGKFRDL